MKRFFIILLSIYFSITFVQATNLAEVYSNSDATNFQEIDFNPYIRDLQRRIKYNWKPPESNTTHKTVVFMKIDKNGKLLSCKIHKTSGLRKMDNAAINAVKATTFRPLPSDYNGQSVDIIFSFNYTPQGFHK